MNLDVSFHSFFFSANAPKIDEFLSNKNVTEMAKKLEITAKARQVSVLSNDNRTNYDCKVLFLRSKAINRYRNLAIRFSNFNTATRSRKSYRQAN